MSNATKLPRDLIAEFVRNPRSVRFVERLQEYVVDYLPPTIKQIFTEIQEAKISADQASALAIHALHAPKDDVLPPVAVATFAEQTIESVSVFAGPTDILNPV